MFTQQREKTSQAFRDEIKHYNESNGFMKKKLRILKRPNLVTTTLVPKSSSNRSNKLHALMNIQNSTRALNLASTTIPISCQSNIPTYLNNQFQSKHNITCSDMMHNNSNVYNQFEGNMLQNCTDVVSNIQEDEPVDDIGKSPCLQLYQSSTCDKKIIPSLPLQNTIDNAHFEDNMLSNLSDFDWKSESEQSIDIGKTQNFTSQFYSRIVNNTKLQQPYVTPSTNNQLLSKRTKPATTKMNAIYKYEQNDSTKSVDSNFFTRISASHYSIPTNISDDLEQQRQTSYEIKNISNKEESFTQQQQNNNILYTIPLQLKQKQLQTNTTIFKEDNDSDVFDILMYLTESSTSKTFSIEPNTF